MQVKNISARGWSVNEIMIKPGDTVSVDDSWYAAVKDNKELQVTDYTSPSAEGEMTKAEIVAALKEAGVEFNPADKKADLQVLLDGINKE